MCGAGTDALSAAVASRMIASRPGRVTIFSRRMMSSMAASRS